MFPLFETIAILDGIPQHLSWHQSRVNDSFFRFFNSAEAPDLKSLIVVTAAHRKGRIKCRFSYSASDHSIVFSKYVSKKITTLKLVEGNHIDYSMKYADRFSLDQLLKLKGKCDEILIVKNKRITDTSYTNIVFFDGDRWVTPRNPLLEGTCRNRLISERRIVEAEIMVENLHQYKTFKLINAMLNFDEVEGLPVNQITLSLFQQ